jgi:ribonucleoside-diphosphate reductase alpha chain
MKNPSPREDAATQAQPQHLAGLTIQPYFTVPGVHPFEKIAWEKRTARLLNSDGDLIFEQHDVEVPDFWSQTATNIVAQKYFYGTPGAPDRETSVKQLVERVTRTISDWGQRDGYFATEADAQGFYYELSHLLINQKAAFNSPVWFNVGTTDAVEKPQSSACFINAVEDSMESILDLAKTEGFIFKYGSGSGVNLSPLRSSKEFIRGSGNASGPVSFMRGYDAFAGVIKSGSKSRRAAKMVLLNIDHPDIVDFITCKAHEEQKAQVLINQGYPAEEAYDSIAFQNANNSVRVTDEFMQAVLDDRDWQTRMILTGEAADTYKARDLLKMIAEAAHACGDPGMQYDTTINTWHTCPDSGRIDASNPCAEYMFLPNSSCNLASLNVLRFRHENGDFDIESFLKAVHILIIAQDILVDNSSYPTPEITANSHRFRPLGLGFTNLGALLMARGLPYDSEAGRAYTAVITALMCGQAYKTSALVAEVKGPFEGYRLNRDPMLKVIQKHRHALTDIDRARIPKALWTAARTVWDEAFECGTEYGYRNAQATVLAPTGTISFFMDCDTTGIEPELALVKYKHLAGGGTLKMINGTVPQALHHLGYSDEEQQAILKYIEINDTIEGAPALKEDDLAVFDCAFPPRNGKRVIQYDGHIKMMAAVQPFISGAISKTINVPNSITPEEIAQIYTTAWELGLKAIAIYRDGSKQMQPLTTSDNKKEEKAEYKPVRHPLPDERQSITHKFSVGGHKGYVTVGMYEDGTPGELFLVMSKEGSTISGMMDGFATAISMALQYGVPLEVLVNKFAHSRFEPSGFTNNPQIRMAKSILDYIFRWLALKFLNPEDRPSIVDQSPPSLNGHDQNGHDQPDTEEALTPEAEARQLKLWLKENEYQVFQAQSDAPPCSICGAIMVRNGSCYKCMNCGTTSGCS